MTETIIDLHNDAFTCLSPKRFSRYIASAEKAGVESILVSVWTTNMQNPMQQIQHCRQILDAASTNVKLFLHIEDAWFISEKNIQELISYKPYSVGLTWNANNNLAGGASEDGMLTPEGAAIIQKFTEVGIIIDLAHLNKTSFYQAAEILRASGRKLFCTHTCFDEVNPHPRNLDRAQIKTITDSGGLIGLTLVGDFLGSNNHTRMHNVYEHIMYFVKNFGEDNIAIGTDFFGTANLPKGLTKYKDFKRFRKLLLKKGLSITTINKIFWCNAKEFFHSYN